MHERTDAAGNAETVLLDSSPPKRSCDMSCSQIVAVICCAIVAILLGVGMLEFGVSKILQIIINLLPESPSFSWYVFMCLATMLSIVILMPIWPPMCMLNGLVFGFAAGSIVNFIAIFGAASISLLLGRSLLQNSVRSCIFDGDYPHFKRILLVLEDDTNTIMFLLLFRFLFIPMFIRNYGPSLLEVPAWKIVITVIPHAIWISMLFASLGSSFQGTADLLRKGHSLSVKSFKWQQALIVGVGFSMTAVLTFYAHRKYSEKLEEDNAAPLNRQMQREVAVSAQA